MYDKMDDRRDADLDQILSIFLKREKKTSEVSSPLVPVQIHKLIGHVVLSVAIWAKCTKELNKNSKRQCW